MAIFTVTTTADNVADDGKLSLREAVRQANAGTAADRIVFASGLEGKTLVLTQGELTVKQDVTIDGDSNNDGKEVTLSGGNASRIFRVTGGSTDVSLRDLTLTHGRTTGENEDGGAILAEFGTRLVLSGTTVRNSSTAGPNSDGGGIFADSATLLHSVVSGNSATGYDARGGGVRGGTVILLHSVVSGNSTGGFRGYGGGILGDFVTLVDSIVSGNSTIGAGAPGGGIFGNGVMLTDSTVSGNSTTGEYARGGGVSGSSVTLLHSVVSGNSTIGAGSDGGGIFGHEVMLTDSIVTGNSTTGDYAAGGGIYGSGRDGATTLTNSTVSGNSTAGYRADGGGVFGRGYGGSAFTLTNSTVSGNSTAGYRADGGGVFGGGATVVTDSTVTGNSTGDDARGGGISVDFGGAAIANSVVAGNAAAGVDDDVNAVISASNGHNIFGSDVDGAILGDLQGVAPGLLFASLDPDTGGGRLNAAGVVPLRNSVTNPALSGGDPLAALPTDQLGTARPLPSGSLPDIGATERNQALSTSPSGSNDVLTGTDGIDAIAGKAGADLILGRGGSDSLRGEGGSDVIDGGPGNDLLDGGDGIDLARFGGSAAVAIDLVAGTAKRGSETDTLTSIQGAIGSSAGDTFKGDGGPNWFQGGGGRDVATGGAARDLYDFDRVQDSLPGAANRDMITDFAPQSDRIDLTGIDADATVPGNQAFVLLDTDPPAFTGPGQLGRFRSDGDVIVRGSTDGDAAPEFEIQLTGLTFVGGDAFYL